MKKVTTALFAAIGALGLVALVIILLGLPVMFLWNWLMPGIFGLREITFFEALGVQLLAYLIFPKSVTKIES